MGGISPYNRSSNSPSRKSSYTVASMQGGSIVQSVLHHRQQQSAQIKEQAHAILRHRQQQQLSKEKQPRGVGNSYKPYNGGAVKTDFNRTALLSNR